MSQRNDWLNWIYLLGDWGYIAGAIAIHLLFPGPVVYILMIIIIGSRMRALANLTHEAAHFKLYRNRKVNNFAGRWLCAWPILIPYAKYVADHRLHHRYLWLSRLDPDFRLYALTHTEQGSSTKESFTRFSIKHVLLVIIPLMPAKRLWNDAAASRQRLLSISILALAIFPVSFLAPGIIAQVIVFCWIIPWFTTFQCISYWAELGEHAGLQNLGLFWGSRNWKGNIFTRWLIGSHSDDIYHLLHHWFPTVPHYKLRLLDSLCQKNWPEYQNHVRCTGFFFGTEDGISVLKDMWIGAD